MITNHDESLIDTSLIDEATLSETVTFVWETFVGTEIHEGPPADFDDVHSAAISIGGPWTATIIVSMGHELVGRYTSALLEIAVDELATEDIRDALGELVNVVGGNIKGLLDDDGQSTLSLPVVSRQTPQVAGSHLSITSSFVADGLPMRWEIHERA